MAIETVGVVGGGFMGSGIAESAARAGIEVIVREPREELLEHSRGRIERSLDRALERGKLDGDEREATLGRIEFTTHVHELHATDIVIEAVPEREDLKRDIFRQLDEVCEAKTILASNTSSIPIAELASETDRADRVLGLHFFSPVPVMALVEVVEALGTSAETAERARAFATQLGKTPIPTKDRAGFIVNMLLVPYLMAAVRMYEEGFADRESIDEAMKLGCGHPMGPLTLCDFIGLDVLYAVCDSLYEEFKLPAYAPPPLMKRMIATGMLGRKSGRGFYEYGEA